MAEDRFAMKREREAEDRSYDPSGFVLLNEVIPDAVYEIRYFSSFNFVGERIDGYEEPLAFLTKEAAAALKEAAKELRSMGYRFKIYDAYRPQRAVDHFVRWAGDPEDTKMKEIFYSESEKETLIPQGYIAKRSGHSRGSTVDLTLADEEGEDLDMGGIFDYFGELSHPDHREITEVQHENRMLLRGIMMKHGFLPVKEEWWHFTLKEEPYPDTYFDFPVSRNSIRNDETRKQMI